MAHADLTCETLDSVAILKRVAGPQRGALVLFVGTVRDHHAGRAVVGISYAAYRPMAEHVLLRIAQDLEAAEPNVAVAIAHRLGDIGVGQASVAIAVAAAHREGAFRASRTALERLKAEAPIWKRERYGDGTSDWREEEALSKSR
jgi:molybdopterin synthase catalytic subunit